jgi:hypothetical protein
VAADAGFAWVGTTEYGDPAGVATGVALVPGIAVPGPTIVGTSVVQAGPELWPAI